MSHLYWHLYIPGSSLKMNLLAFKSLNGLAPCYLTELLQSYTAAKALRPTNHAKSVLCMVLYNAYSVFIGDLIIFFIGYLA